MSSKRLFTHMTLESRRFYSPIFNRLLLNIHAVQTGTFDTLFCETEDPRITLRWEAALPHVVNAIHEMYRRPHEGDEQDGH